MKKIFNTMITMSPFANSYKLKGFVASAELDIINQYYSKGFVPEYFPYATNRMVFMSKRLHLKHRHVAHYQTADKRIRQAVEYALFRYKCPYNGHRLQKIVSYRRFSWI